MRDYDALSGSYDALMADGDYRRRIRFLDRALRKAGAETVLDLGCGTGTVAWGLAERGYRVVAVDGSREMLTEAMRKAGTGTPPLFVCQKMPSLRLGAPVDAAVSTLDSLNYLTTERALRQTLSRVYRYLRPGGVFLFDVNTPCKLRRMDRQMYMDEDGERFCVWRTFFSERTACCTWQVDLFRQRRDGAWERSMEEHRERAWRREEWERFLTEAGFTGLRVTGDLTGKPPREDEDRWNIRAEKERQ